VSGRGIASAASVGAGEEGRDGNAVNVKGDSGDIGNGCTADGTVVVELRGFSFACRGDPNARGLGARVVGELVGGSNGGLVGVVTGGDGGIDGGAVGAVAIWCDNFDGASGP
jgi:hypothetical protein